MRMQHDVLLDKTTTNLPVDPGTMFSCSSTCLDYQSKVQCLKSPFDRVTPLSRAVTEDFPHVVYMANFSQHLDTLLPFVPMTNEPQEILRVAYVSGQSKLVKQILADEGHSTSQAIFVAWRRSRHAEVHRLRVLLAGNSRGPKKRFCLCT